ncbi:hypothetical protein PIB30_060874 [Stylosanthes scabra]|uniref:Uncharacterized protein n=1 Tax=Stylosanthes scabra TaxID=79078 RepID=A0ABU6ZJD7_9FABA|nr:hypothetical protein [Stylosanthes scabra]
MDWIHRQEACGEYSESLAARWDTWEATLATNNVVEVAASYGPNNQKQHDFSGEDTNHWAKTTKPTTLILSFRIETRAVVGGLVQLVYIHICLSKQPQRVRNSLVEVSDPLIV